MKSFIAILLAAAALAATPAAANVTVGTGTGGNCFPFGCKLDFPSTVYQQVYAAGAFSAPFSIKAVRFERIMELGSTLNGGTYTLSVSTTSVTPLTINITDFAANIGADDTRVFSGTLAPNFDGRFLTFTFGTPYLYNPAAGSLLLNFSAADVTGTLDFDTSTFFNSNDGDADGAFSRAHNFGTGFTDFGLQTTFIGSVVPEPATWAMMIAGFGLVGAAARRRQPAIA